MAQTLYPLHVHAAPVEPTDFAAVMAEQLRRAPWMAVSIALHAILILLIALLLPAPQPPAAVRPALQVLPEQPALPALPPPPPVVPPPVVEQRDVVPVLQDPAVDAPVVDAPADDAIEGDPDAPALNTNPAVGLGGARRRGTDGLHGPRGGPSGDGARRKARLASLDWLVRHQDEDGKWDCDGFMKHDRQGAPCDGAGNGVHDIGVTGLAMLAFLGEGSTLKQGPYQEPLRKAAIWLRDQQAANGLFGSASSSDFIYDHAIAAYAMCEAYGLSDHPLLRRPAQLGIDYLAAHRNPYRAWRYQPRDGDNDVSVTGWCAVAMASAQHFGLQVDDGFRRATLALLDECTDAAGRCGYSRRGEPSSRHPGTHAAKFPVERGEAMTAVALFVRAFLGQQPRENPCMEQAAELLARKPPVWDDGGVDHYYWYYGAHALYQMGGKHLRAWSQPVEQAICRHQRTDGSFEGSWDPACVWGQDGGRVYSTALLALTLQAHQRYSRLIR